MVLDHDPDAALMLRVKQGDRDAFTQLVDRYQQPIVTFVSRMLHDVAEAEDVAQKVFVQVYRAADRYNERCKFSTWLFTIAHRLCLNEIRRRSRHRTESMDAPPPDQEERPSPQFVDKRALSPAEEVLQTELEATIAQALAGLPEDQRSALVLCLQEDLSYEEIGQVLGRSLSAIKSLIFRARETMKTRIKAYL